MDDDEEEQDEDDGVSFGEHGATSVSGDHRRITRESRALLFFFFLFFFGGVHTRIHALFRSLPSFSFPLLAIEELNLMPRKWRPRHNGS